MNAKKLLSLLLALTMMATISVTAFAEGDEDVINENDAVVEDVIVSDTSYDAVQTTTVYTQIQPQFTVTIPSTVNVDYKSNSKTFNVVLDEGAMLNKNYFVRVGVTSSNGYSLVNEDTSVGYGKKDYINYSLSYVNYVEDGISHENSYPYLYNGGQLMAYTISIQPSEWLSIHSGYYSDTLTFTLDYVHTSTLG